MMSRAPRWNDQMGNNKPNKPTQKKVGKDQAEASVSVLVGGKQPSTCLTKTSKGGISLKGIVQHGNDSHLGARSPSRPSRSALRLCSSRSFSSLHTPSINAPPFIRSSRSLGRLDHRSFGDDSDHMRNIQSTGGKILHRGHRSSSLEQIRVHKDRCSTNHTEVMKTSSSSQQRESSSSLVPTAACLHHKDIKQTRDGIYTLCAMTSGMRRNLVQAVLKNARPGLSHVFQSSPLEPNKDQMQEHQTHDQRDESDSGLQDKEPEPSQSLPIEDILGFPCVALTTDSQVPEDRNTHQCSHMVEAEGTGEKSNISHSDHLTEELKMERETEQSCQKDDPKDQQTPLKITSNGNEWETMSPDPHSVQLVKELECTQRELSRLQQLNKNLQEDLKQERENHSKDCSSQNNANSSPDRSLAFQQMQKINHDLRTELEAQRRIHEEAREAELRRRVDLLAQQAQLLVTGDATALAQAHIAQDRRQFKEQQVEWERCTTSLKSQLDTSEEKRKQAESRLTQVQQELHGCQSLQEEADDLQKRLQDVTARFRTYEEGQTEKETQLQKHLTLLQASQERERKSLAASLITSEERSKELQEQLNRAEQEIEGLRKTQTGTKEIEILQQQLQEELDRTVSAMQQLLDEKKQLNLHCEELQNQILDAKRKAERMQECLKTDETQYYNLEHTHERVCEELRVVLGKLQQKEIEMQEMGEGYERLLDTKEEELSEVLLKMEVLGNSLEETEVKLNEVLKVGSSQPNLHKNINNLDEYHINGTDSLEPERSRSHSVDSTHCVHPEGEDVDSFMSMIQSLETKLYITEEKLRDITRRLEEYQSHNTCQNPQLCSQLTQSKATAQHLSLMLHSQATQSQRFAQDTESLCRTLGGRFQVALNIALTCSDAIQASTVNLSHLKRHLNTIAACLQQGAKEAERHEHESLNTKKEEWKRLNDEKLVASETNVHPRSEVIDGQLSQEDVGGTQEYLMKEQFVVEKIVTALQNQEVALKLKSMSTEVEGGLAWQYKKIISQKMALKNEFMMRLEREDCNSDKSSMSVICLACAEAELIYTALKLQQKRESRSHENHQSLELQRDREHDTNPLESDPYEELMVDSDVSGEATTREQKDLPEKIEATKEPEWLERLTSRLQSQAKFLHQIYQDLSDDNQDASVHSINQCPDLHFLQEQTKLVYLSNRIYLDLEDILTQMKELQQEVEVLCKQDLMNEQLGFNHTLCQLQKSNTTLREELHQAEKNNLSLQSEKQRLLEDLKKVPDYHKEVEEEFQEKIKELQQIHEDEMKHLHACYAKLRKSCTAEALLTEGSISEQKTTKENTETFRHNSENVREDYQEHPRSLQESCDREVIAMAEMHRKAIEDLQQQHQKEVAELQEEKEQLLKEETAATMAAIVAMRKAHQQELQKTRRAQRVRESADITQLCLEYEKEIQLLHDELETLSVQHSEKCVENTQLNQELQMERESVMQCQQINKEKENDEVPEPPSKLNGKQTQVIPQVDDFYEMEVILRAREAEMQFLKQEARALREELKVARMDKIYAQNKLKALCTINGQSDKQQRVNTHTEDLHCSASLKDSATNVTLPKKSEKPSLLRQIRAVRSKSLREGLTVQEKKKLFES